MILDSHGIINNFNSSVIFKAIQFFFHFGLAFINYTCQFSYYDC